MNYKRYRLQSLIPILIILLGSEIVLSQPDTTWTKTFGGIEMDRGYSVQQTSDGGYIITGATSNFGSGGTDVWLIKTDASGTESWNKTFGGTSYETGRSVKQTSDGGYVIVATTDSYGNGKLDYWLIKTDSEGNEEWNKTFGGTDNDELPSVQQTADGGYALVGATRSYGSGGQDVWLIKTDASGTELWNKTLGGTDDEIGHAFQQTTDGGYIITGAIQYSENNKYDALLIKTDSNGAELWSKTFGGSERDYTFAVQQTTDGGFIISGLTRSFGNGQNLVNKDANDVWLIKTDASGIELWSKTFGGSKSDYAYAVQQTIDLGYIIVGSTWSFGNGRINLWLIKTDSNGTELWNKTFGGSEYDKGRSVQQTSDGGYIIVGTTSSYGNGSDDIWLIKLNGKTLKVPSAYSTIQAAIDAATTGDTVLVADGTYTENLIIDKDITIISENGAEKTIIDGGKITHVIAISSSTTRDCVLDGFTVTNGGNANGDSDDGAGGINVWGGSPTLRNLIITGNRREKWSGGGIHVNNNGNPLVEGCTIKENYAEDGGGGIDVWRASIKIKDTILENNSAKYTGAMSIGTDDTLDFRPIIDIENVEVINQRDSTIEQMVSISDCSLTVKNLSFSNIRTESSLGSFYNSYVNIENLSLKDIRDNGHSLLFIGSKGTVSGLTIERDTSRWAIVKIEQGSKIDFNNLKMSNCTTTDHAGLFITSNPTASIVNIDTLDINNCNWKSHSISVDNSIFTLDNGKISNITAQEGSAGLNAWSCNSIDVSNTIIDSSYSGSNGGMIFYQVKKVNIKNSSFIANRSGEGGGGIHVNEVDSLFIDNCSFLSDSSDASGTLDLGNGKFYSLKGLIMENNYAADAAGAINLWGNEKVEIIDSKFISNKSVTNAGAIYSWNTDSLFIDNSIFNGNESTDGNGGAMYFIGDEDSPLYHEIKNTTFENNSSNESGAIAALAPIDMNIDSVFATGNEVSINGGFISLCCGASVSINHSTINNNIAKDNGGAINGHDGSLDILNSNFSNNECGNQGGAIRYRNGPLNIFNSSFKYNKSIEGNTGAVDFAKNDDSQISNLTITQSDFIGNTSNRFVGALRAKRADSTWIKHTVFDSNEVETWGGAAEIGSSKYLEIDSSTITNNMANGNAAGLTVGDIGEGIIKNSIFANNIMKDADADTSFGGGLTLWGDANIKSINNTFVGNKAYKASAIGVRDSSNLELVNTIIWDNPGTTQLGLYIDGTLTAKNSVIGDGKASIDMDDMSKITSYDDQTMIETNPLLCDFWSGSWPQLAGNYHLTYLSPAIGKGENGVNMGAFDVGCDIDTALLSVDELIDVTPTVSALHENYPNPFNPTTTLRFDLPEVSSITLTIYNMLGQRVRTFNMNDTPAGYHSIKWNATNDYGDPVGAGVYLYQLRANQYVKTRKMVLLK